MATDLYSVYSLELNVAMITERKNALYLILELKFTKCHE